MSGQRANDSRGVIRLRCLWLSRDIPFPLDAGDKIYSAHLAKSLAQADTELRFMGFLGVAREQVPHDWLNDWVAVDGAKRDSHAALFSRHPRIAALHATAAYQHLLAHQLQEHWDALILDGYGSGWALRSYLSSARKGKHIPTLIYVSHNHEESLWRSMLNATDGAVVKKIAVWQNYLKVRALERALARNAQLITTITEEDARVYSASTPQTPSLVLTPGYSGRAHLARTITAETPRRVVMVGSFHWLIKQENLRRFVTLADGIFAQHSIALDVIGDAPAILLQELRKYVRATQLRGYVDDVSTYFERARIAVVPEVVGGGFKLKFLDYIFGRVPVATIATAAAGLPNALRECMFCYDDLEALIHGIVANIDRVDSLNRMQQQAYAQAGSLFRWDDRGQRLRAAIKDIKTN